VNSGEPRRDRLLRLRVVWLPLLLVVLDAILLVIVLLLAVVLVPLIILGLLIVALARSAVYVLSGGRWGMRRREPAEAAERRPAGRPRLSPEQRRELALRYRPCTVFTAAG